MRKNTWLATILVVLMLSVIGAGCATKTTTEAPPQTPVTTPAVTIAQVADQYFAELPVDNNMISPADLKTKVDAADPNLLLIDLRKAEDYAKNHIKGAVNIPFAKLGENLDKLPADKDIVVYCYSGQSGGQAVALLDMYGYKVKSLNLGFDKGWVGKNSFPGDTAVNQLPAGVTPAKPNAAIAELIKNYLTTMPANTNFIPSKDLQALIDKGENMQIIDLRSAADYAKGHIKGAVNIPFRELNKHFAEIAKDKPVYVYCYSGQTGAQTTAILNVMGYKSNSLLSGFDLGWTAEKMPVTQ